MIGLLALAIPSAPTVVLHPVPDAKAVTIQALVRMPKLSEAERFCALVAWDSVLEGSEEYSRLTLRAYGQQTGRALAATALGDHLLLRVTFPKEQLAIGVSMTESILLRPLLLAESLQNAIARRQQATADSWTAALSPEGWAEAKPTRDEILATYRRLVRPENVVLAFGGAFDSREIASQMSRFQDWSPRTERLPVRSWAARTKPLLKSPGASMFFELAAMETPAGAASMPAELLAAAVLGSGKGSALHRVAREANGWSYRQEGFLQPTSGGLRFRMLLARSPVDDPAAFLTEWRAAMLADAKQWTQADRGRALAQLQSWLKLGLGVAPVRLLPEGRILASMEERTHLRAWWRLKFGFELDEADMLAKLGQVRLEEVKAVAEKWIETSSARFQLPNTAVSSP